VLKPFDENFKKVEFIFFSRHNGYMKIVPTGKAVKGVS